MMYENFDLEKKRRELKSKKGYLLGCGILGAGILTNAIVYSANVYSASASGDFGSVVELVPSVSAMVLGGVLTGSEIERRRHIREEIKNYLEWKEPVKAVYPKR